MCIRDRISERAKVPPSSSKTSETVVEVGIPMELNTSDVYKRQIFSILNDDTDFGPFLH